MRSIEAEGSSIDEAIAKAIATLRVERDQIEVEILANATRGLFGFGGRPARVRATVRESLARVLRQVADVARGTSGAEPDAGGSAAVDATAAARARDVLGGILEHVGVECAVEVGAAVDAGTVMLTVRGEGSGLIIGRRGQTLDALEYLLNRIASRGGENAPRIVIDVEHYRERRQESLEQMARHLAAKARKTGRIVTLNPMSPRDRRVVHVALQGDDSVVTRSQGDGHYRKLLIIPQNRLRRGETPDAQDS